MLTVCKPTCAFIRITYTFQWDPRNNIWLFPINVSLYTVYCVADITPTIHCNITHLTSDWFCIDRSLVLEVIYVYYHSIILDSKLVRQTLCSKIPIFLININTFYDSSNTRCGKQCCFIILPVFWRTARLYIWLGFRIWCFILPVHNAL